jgi:uncharacterized protein YdhG (YjbR/CyaY superfamily)
MKTSTQKFTTIDEYIALFPKDVQSKLKELRKVIKEEAPKATETIKYQMPTFVLSGHLVYFAGYKNHIGFYPFPSGIEAFKKEASAYKTFKGTIQFPIDEPVPFDLVRKIVRYRIKENLEKEKRKESDYSRKSKA